ncbi:hypothetical protein M407DRAFT_193019 [Tulasnella calospora MUT 4182]|uniref:Uncharacterized protein n=1 Tax=Tulasnella calospora MUT 4182 TaxID=1051891 RepID=A0A0C3QAJ9_9AGAM|nr:hypothetical protein M407DRAFT_193019 [Tulasnella calospora MUT 4182]
MADQRQNQAFQTAHLRPISLRQTAMAFARFRERYAELQALSDGGLKITEIRAEEEATFTIIVARAAAEVKVSRPQKRRTYPAKPHQNRRRCNDPSAEQSIPDPLTPAPRSEVL